MAYSKTGMEHGESARGKGRYLAVLAVILTIIVSAGAAMELSETDGDNVTISINPAFLELGVGATGTITVTVTGSADTSVTWTINQPEVASLDEPSGIVTALSQGSAILTATSNADPNKSANCTVMVTAAVKSVTLSDAQVTLKGSETKQLTATVKPDDTDKTVVWSSSAPNVATVSSTGLVTGVGEGAAIITAASAVDPTVKGECAVNVSKVNVSKVTINETNPAVEINKTIELHATVTPTNALNKTVTWSSANDAVATVDPNTGVVKGISVGTVKITATSNQDNTKKAEVTLTVTDVLVSKITLNKTSVSLNVGSTEKLTYTVEPSNAANKTVKWTSSNTSVATVSDDGTITAVKKGTATITATANDYGKKTATCTVTVKNISVTGVTVSGPKEVSIGKDIQLTVTITPSNATIKTVKWTCDDTSKATVDSNGKVTGLKEGTVKITATSDDDSKKTGTYTVTVKKIPVTSVTLNQTSVPSLPVRDTLQLTATVSPQDATYKSVVWSSSDSSIATVDQNGLVKAIKAGAVVITAKSDGVEGKCSIQVVNIKVTGVTLDKTEGTLEADQKLQLTAAVAPQKATDYSVSWSSSNASIATVDQKGLVTAIKAGTATITVTTNDGGFTATCTVTVEKTYTITPLVDSNGKVTEPDKVVSKVNDAIGRGLVPVVRVAADRDDVTVQNTVVSAVATSKTGFLEIGTKAGSMSFPSKALTKLNASIPEFTFGLKTVPTPANATDYSPSITVDAYISSNGLVTPVKFNTQIDIYVNYTLKAGDDPNELKVLYVPDSGSVQLVRGAEYILNAEGDSLVHFETNHTSNYSVVLHKISLPDGYSIVIAAVFLVIMLVLVIFVFLLMRRTTGIGEPSNRPPIF